MLERGLLPLMEADTLLGNANVGKQGGPSAVHQCGWGTFRCKEPTDSVCLAVPSRGCQLCVDSRLW